MIRVRPSPRNKAGPFAVAAFVEMVASRSPSCVAALDVEPLREVWLGIPSTSNTLKAEVGAVLEDCERKADMLEIRYEYM